MNMRRSAEDARVDVGWEISAGNSGIFRTRVTFWYIHTTSQPSQPAPIRPTEGETSASKTCSTATVKFRTALVLRIYSEVRYLMGCP